MTSLIYFQCQVCRSKSPLRKSTTKDNKQKTQLSFSGQFQLLTILSNLNLYFPFLFPLDFSFTLSYLINSLSFMTCSNTFVTIISSALYLCFPVSLLFCRSRIIFSLSFFFVILLHAFLFLFVIPFSFNSFRFQISFPILDDLHLLFPYTMSTDRHFWSFSIVMYTYSIVYALQLSTSSFLPLSSCCRYHAQHNQCLILLSPPSCSRSKSSLC